MKQIWKYPIKIGERIIEMPKGAKILCVKEQFEQICLWVEVYPANKKEKRHFIVYGTGHIINDTAQIYLGSVKLLGGALIYHIYELIGK